MKALVLNGDLKSALATVRSLGMQNIEVCVGSERSTGMACHSKYASDTFVYPSPYSEKQKFIETIYEKAKDMEGKPVVFAFSDATFLSLFEAKERLSEVATLVFPEEKDCEIAFDKAATYSLARTLGVPTIETFLPETKEELEHIASTKPYPMVLKTRKSVTWNDDGYGIFGTATFVHTKDDVLNTYIDVQEETGEGPMVQAYINGDEYGVEMLAEKGVTVARVVHHRLRSLSPTGGASVLKETLEHGALRKKLVEYAEKLCTALNWSGPIMVEFKVDKSTGTAFLMEVNGRFWGSLPLAVFAGVDMPYVYYQYALGNTPDEIIEDREHVVSVHQAGDMAHIIRALFTRDRMRSIAYPSRLHAVRDFLFLPFGVRSDVWSWSDPKPAVMEIIDILKRKK